MNLKYISAVALALAFSSSFANAQNKSKVATKTTTKTHSKPTAATAALPALKTAKDSLSYAIGLQIGKSIKSADFDLDLQVLNLGISNLYQGKALLLDENKTDGIIQAAAMNITEMKNAKLKQESADFLTHNKAKAGIKETAEGIQYEVLQAGTGAHPTAEDEVTVHYHGALANGETFDSSYARNEPVTLELDRVIEGWKIGVPLMQVGAKYRFFIPYNLGYGERGTRGIPPYSTLVFDIELLGIKKAHETEAAKEHIH
ncbi:FKBP-type peptidyl-prolyl cis-trans isomerase [Sphingobacterium sp. Mn56C]|uniref:FKBP-type peptidyl-prolyl cis-trans isomerase n=1 Tax=Sphingobacterium sp. Mn56C TaxID=3395261 RepID=UPI003BBA85C9